MQVMDQLRNADHDLERGSESDALAIRATVPTIAIWGRLQTLSDISTKRLWQVVRSKG